MNRDTRKKKNERRAMKNDMKDEECKKDEKSDIVSIAKTDSVTAAASNLHNYNESDSIITMSKDDNIDMISIEHKCRHLLRCFDEIKMIATGKHNRQMIYVR